MVILSHPCLPVASRPVIDILDAGGDFHPAHLPHLSSTKVPWPMLLSSAHRLLLFTGHVYWDTEKGSPAVPKDGGLFRHRILMVLGTGVEPAHLAARDPKTRASANSATPASMMFPALKRLSKQRDLGHVRQPILRLMANALYRNTLTKG